MTQTILHLDSSARTEGSITRDFSARVAGDLGGTIIRRDLAEPVPQVSEAWVNANLTAADERDEVQRDTLAFSDVLVDEVVRSDVLVLGVPVYNFGVPAAFKAWVDQICRAGVTFRYSETGPVGLLEGKRAIVLMASGGTQIGSDIDFASGYVRHILGFIGIHDVEIIAADALMIDAEKSLASANEKIAALLAA